MSEDKFLSPERVREKLNQIILDLLEDEVKTRLEGMRFLLLPDRPEEYTTIKDGRWKDND